MQNTNKLTRMEIFFHCCRNKGCVDNSRSWQIHKYSPFTYCEVCAYGKCSSNLPIHGINCNLEKVRWHTRINLVPSHSHVIRSWWLGKGGWDSRWLYLASLKSDLTWASTFLETDFFITISMKWNPSSIPNFPNNRELETWKEVDVRTRRVTDLWVWSSRSVTTEM